MKKLLIILASPLLLVVALILTPVLIALTPRDEWGKLNDSL